MLLVSHHLWLDAPKTQQARSWFGCFQQLDQSLSQFPGLTIDKNFIPQKARILAHLCLASNRPSSSSLPHDPIAFSASHCQDAFCEYCYKVAQPCEMVEIFSHQLGMGRNLTPAPFSGCVADQPQQCESRPFATFLFELACCG